MNAPEPTYASFPLVLSQKSYPFRLPAYRASHLRRYHPYPRSRSSRALDLDDPLTQTIGTRYDGPRLDHLLPTIEEEDPKGEVINLHDALSPKDGRALVMRISLSTLVVDLALAVRRRLESLRRVRKETELQFDMLI